MNLRRIKVVHELDWVAKTGEIGIKLFDICICCAMRFPLAGGSLYAEHREAVIMVPEEVPQHATQKRFRWVVRSLPHSYKKDRMRGCRTHQDAVEYCLKSIRFQLHTPIIGLSSRCPNPINPFGLSSSSLGTTI